MRLKILITLMMFFVLNILLVNSQEGCPPDCSSSSKITDKSYLNPEAYKDKDFYKYSDPQRWDFSNPNFDYNQIPLEKYKELPYDNPSIDHSRLDSNKYICAMGCCTCTFLLRTTQVKYAVDGVKHPKTGLAKIPSDYPPLTLFIADRDRIIIVLPSIGQHKLDISNVGSATIFTNNKEVILSDEVAVNGKLSFIDNQPYVRKNDEITIDGIKINPKGNDVYVYFDGLQHKGNYVSYGQKNLFAEGNNFDLEFLPENKLVKVVQLYKGAIEELKSKISISLGISKPINPEILQNDYLYVSFGGNGKSGVLKLNNRENANLMPMLETKGYLRVLNGQQDIIIDDNMVRRIAVPFSKFKVYRDSASMQLSTPQSPNSDISQVDEIFGSLPKPIYTFNENNGMEIIPEENAKKLDELRTTILEKYQVVLNGYFDKPVLEDITTGFKNIEALGIDFSKYEQANGKKIEMLEQTIKITNLKDVLSAFKTVATANEPTSIISWNPIIFRGPRTSPYTQEEESNIRIESTVHEVGHILLEQSYQKLIDAGNKFGMHLDTKKGNFEPLNKGPEYLFPSYYSKFNAGEFNTELFTTMVRNSKWFTDPYNGGSDKYGLNIILANPVSPEIMKQRQALGNIVLEGLEKYKKS